METKLGKFTVDEVLSLGSTELRDKIRAYDLHSSLGISGSELSKMAKAELQAIAISGAIPSKLSTQNVEKTLKQSGHLIDEFDEIIQTKKPKNRKMPKQKRNNNKADTIVQLFNEIVGDAVTPNDIEEKIEKKVREAVQAMVPVKIQITAPNKEVTEIDAQHYKFPLILKCVEQRLNVALVGPAGSGKSMLCENIAKALNLEFTPMSFNQMTSKSDVLSFVDANGKARWSHFQKRYENGGVFLADEFDAANAGIATILNAAIANGICSFSDGRTIKQHPDFVFIAAMNTFGTGADIQYVGRNRLDAATLDRFCFIELDYDRHIEAVACGHPNPPKQKPFSLDSGGIPTVSEWLDTIWTLRKKAHKEQIKAIFSPRASIMGTQLASAGVGREHLTNMFIAKGLSKTEQEKLNIT